MWALREAIDRHARVDNCEEQARVRGHGDQSVQADDSAARAGRERRALGGQSEAEAQRHEGAGEDRRRQANIGEEIRGGRGITHRHANHGSRWPQQQRKERADATNEHEMFRARPPARSSCARRVGKFARAKDDVEEHTRKRRTKS